MQCLAAAMEEDTYSNLYHNPVLRSSGEKLAELEVIVKLVKESHRQQKPTEPQEF